MCVDLLSQNIHVNFVSETSFMTRSNLTLVVAFRAGGGQFLPLMSSAAAAVRQGGGSIDPDLSTVQPLLVSTIELGIAA